MGFFKDLLDKIFAKPKSLGELLEEDHPSAWYEKNKINLFMKMLNQIDGEDLETGFRLYCQKYFNSLDNVAKLKTAGLKVDTLPFAQQWASHTVKQINEADQTKRVAYAAYYFETDPIIRFIKKLNHAIYGTTAYYISDLIRLGYINIDKDAWLYDVKLFTCKDDSESGDKLFEKVSAVLQEKNLLTEEIVEEISKDGEE